MATMEGDAAAQLQQLQEHNQALRRQLSDRNHALAMRDLTLSAAPGIAPMRDSIRTVEGRRKTFVNWPHTGFRTLTPQQLAAAGFFYTPSPEFEDRVTCAYCSLELGSWEDGDNAMLSHREAAPVCPFVSGMMQDTKPFTAFSSMAINPTVPASTHLEDNTWIIEGHVDNENVNIRPDDNGQEVIVRGCRGFNQQTVVNIRGGVRSLTIEDCFNTRVMTESVLLALRITSCNHIQVVLVKESPRIVIKQTTSCQLTLCPDAIDGEIESVSSAGIVVKAVPLSSLPPNPTPEMLLRSPVQNQVVIPDRMVTGVKDGAIVTECKTTN